MKTIELSSSGPVIDTRGAGNSAINKIIQDQRRVSSINIVVNTDAFSEKVSLAVPNVPVRCIVKKIEKLIEEDAFRKIYRKKFSLLTKRERQVLQLLAKGLNNPKISKQLYISRRTVEQHHKNVNRKLDIKCYTDLIKYCEAFELI